MLSAYMWEIIFSIIGLLVVFNIIHLLVVRRMGRRVERLTTLLRMADRASLEDSLQSFQQDIADLQLQLQKIQEWQAQTDQTLGRCARTPVLSRYRAFENTGGDQSYSCALLDGRGDGIVLTSLYSAHSSHAYGKPVLQGVPAYKLSKEEEDVLNQALNRSRSARKQEVVASENYVVPEAPKT